MRIRCLLLAAILLTAVRASAEVAWSIGSADHSFRDLAIAGDFNAYARHFPRDVSYDVGTSTAATDWPFIHPGPQDAWAGSRPHTFTIGFDVPPGALNICQLVIDICNTHYSNPPTLAIQVNDVAPYRFELPAGADDRSLTDPAIGHPYRLTVPLAWGAFNPGHNTIRLTVISGSWLVYDAVRLETSNNIPTTPVISSIDASGTAFFRNFSGTPHQAIRVTVNNTGAPGQAYLDIEGHLWESQMVVLQPGITHTYLLVPPVTRKTTFTIWAHVGTSAVSTNVEVAPARKWLIYAIPSAHTDIGYTDLQEHIYERHTNNTDAALDGLRADRNAKWNLEVAFQAELYKRRPERYAELMERAREGRIGLQGSYLNMLTGLCTGEELARVFERGQQFGDAFGFQVPAATITDVPSTVGTMPMLLRQSGIRYFAEGINQDRGPFLRGAPSAMQQSPFWWEAPDGSRVLAVFTYGYAQMGSLGLRDGVEKVATSIEGWLKQFDRPDYPGDAVYVFGAFSDNELADTRYAQVANEWNDRWDYPHIIVARPDEFFRYVEQTVGPKLPVFRGDMGVWWEDGAGSSAFETALNRWAVTRTETAERWLALVTARTGARFPDRQVDDIRDSVGDRHPSDRDEDIHTAYENALFYDEHTWGAAGSVSDPRGTQTVEQWKQKAAFATQAAETAAKLSNRANQARAILWALPTTGRPETIIAWNELPWDRDVTVDLPTGAITPTAVRDAAGHTIPVQVDGGRMIFVAPSVPSMGYRAYRLATNAVPTARPLLQPGSAAMEWVTPRYRMRIDPATGAIAQLVDRRTGKDRVNRQTGWGLNQLLYVTGGDGSTTMVNWYLKEATVRVLTHTAATANVVENGPTRATLLIHRAGDGVPPVDTRLVLTANGDVEAINTVHKDEVLQREGVYFAFPFARSGRGPVRSLIELPYGYVEADREQLPGACREWYSTVSYAAVADNGSTAILASPHSPLLTLGDVFRGKWRTKIDNPNGTLLAYAMNNYWHTNYKAGQSGDIVFAYRLRFTDRPFDPAEATRFGWQARAEMVDPQAGGSQDILTKRFSTATFGPAPERSQDSLIRVSGGALIGGITVRSGRLIVRLYNPRPVATRATVSLPGARIGVAWLADLTGRVMGPVPASGSSVQASVPARGLTTLAITLTH